MALSKLTYVDNVTVIPASNLNAIQDEVIANGTASASAKSEVEDIRVGADGTTYNTAGSAVRAQVGAIQNVLQNIINLDNSTTKTGYVNPNTGAVVDGYEGYKYFEANVCAGGILLFRSGKPESVSGVSFYKADGTFIIGYAGSSIEQVITVPESAYFAKISYRTSGEDLFYAKLCIDNAYISTMLSSLTEYGTDAAQTGYVNINTGVVVSDNRYNYIDVDVIPSAILVYTAGTNESVAGVAFYDKSKKYISGNAGKKNDLYIPIPANASTAKITYAVASTSFDARMVLTGELLNTAIKSTLLFNTQEVIVDISGNGDYTSILEALKGTESHTPIRIKKGTYDIIAEYEDYYGSSYFTNYTGYSGTSDVFNRGLWLGKGRKVYGDSGVVLKCVYEGANQNVKDYFSVIANDGDVLLENVTIQYANIRYAIHDDFQPEYSTIEWRNIHFDGTPIKAAPIGGGFGLNSTYYIENCTFTNNTKDWDINYHGSNNAAVNNTCVLRVTNCKGAKRCGVWSNGPATSITECYVSNSRFLEVVNYTTSSTTNINVNLTEWCNSVGA